MRVWLLHIGEDLPVDGPTRPFRYSYLAQALQEKGHQVLRWAPTFRHNTKEHRFLTDARIAITQNYSIQFVHSPGYRRNVSFERLRTYRALDCRFRQLVAHESPPDVIVAAIPSLEWAEAALEYGLSRAIPVVVDVRDIWPDVFVTGLPAAARPLGHLLLKRYFRSAQRTCRRATALTAVSQTYLDWALNLAGRLGEPRDVVMPLGFEPEPVSAAKSQANIEKLCSQGIDPSRPICLFVGLFERSYDLETVIEAARRIEAGGLSEVQFVFCGDGSKMPALRRRASGLHRVHFLGWVDAAMLQAVASIASIGLCAYARDALQSLPNKPFEYMAGRLAIASSLPGEMATLLDRHQCGLTYRAGDVGDLTNCLMQLLSSRSRLEAMRARAHETWSSHFRSKDVYARFVDYLASLTPDVARAPHSVAVNAQAA